MKFVFLIAPLLTGVISNFTSINNQTTFTPINNSSSILATTPIYNLSSMSATTPIYSPSSISPSSTINSLPSVSATIMPHYNISCRSGSYQVDNLNYKEINDLVNTLSYEDYEIETEKQYNSSDCGLGIELYSPYENSYSNYSYIYNITYGLFNASECNNPEYKYKNYTICMYDNGLICDRKIIKCCNDKHNYCNDFYTNITDSRYCKQKKSGKLEKGKCIVIIDENPRPSPTPTSHRHRHRHSKGYKKYIIIAGGCVIAALLVTNVVTCILYKKHTKKLKEREPLLKDEGDEEVDPA